MTRGFFEEAKTGMQLLYVVFIFISSWVVFQLVSIFTGLWIFNLDINTAMRSLDNLNDIRMIGYLKYIQSITSIGMFMVSSFVIAWSISKNPLRFLKIHHFPGFFVTVLVVFLTVFTLPMNNYFTYVNNQLMLPEKLSGLQMFFENKEAQVEELMNAFLSGGGTILLLVNIIVIGLIPALGEELIFRGVIQKLLIKAFRNIHLGVFVTAFLFGAFHFQFLSFLPRFILGIILGYLFVWSGSLWMPILMHFINNSLAVVYYHFYFDGRADDTLEVVGTPGNDAVYAALSIVVVTLILFVIRRIRLENQKQTN